MIRWASAAAAIAAAFLFATDLGAQAIRHDLTVGPELLLFKGDQSSEPSAAARGSATFLWTVRPGSGTALTLEPRAGLRVLSFTSRTSTEAVAELDATLQSVPSGRSFRWQVDASTKLRHLSDPPRVPAYLDPSRFQVWTGSTIAIPAVGALDVEARAGAGLVRYGPERWRDLDRNGLLGRLSLIHPLSIGLARLGVAAATTDFVGPEAMGRNDSRWALNVGWAAADPAFIQLEGGLAWNSSNIAAFDYSSVRGAFLLSAPLAGGSAQVYAAIAFKTYQNPGQPDDRVAPSDQDTGSFLIIQATRPLTGRTSLYLRAEWSRSETGFRNVFFQRIGLSALFNFRGPLTF